MNMELKSIQEQIDNFKRNNPTESVGDLSDAVYTYDKLYDHRAVLAALAFMHLPYAWKSNMKKDGTRYENNIFIAGAPTSEGMVVFYFNLQYWDLFKIPEISRSPEYNKEFIDSSLNRLMKFIRSSDIRLVNKNNIEIIEDIVNKDIISLFTTDPLQIASYISFYNR